MTRQDVWGATAITLGVWEAIAVISGRLPTVSVVVARCRRRRDRATRLLVLVWSVALARHLLG